MKKMTVLLVLGAVALAGVVACPYVGRHGRQDPHALQVSGNIEVTDAEVSFKIAGRVMERRVSEGEIVRRGDLVARLDDSDLRGEVAIRRAELESARAALAELEAGSRPEEIAEAQAAVERTRASLAELEAGSRPEEIAAARAAVARARAELADAETNYLRLDRLHEQMVAAQQEYDTAKARYEATRARLEEAEASLRLVEAGPRQEEIQRARAALREMQERYRLVESGPRKETIEQARARVGQARAALELAETRLGYAILPSPLSGVVLSENIEPGEYVAPGTPVVTVGDLQDVWLRAYINETDLGRVKVGQAVEVTTDTYPGKVYHGRLSFLSSEAEFTPRSVQTQKERVKLVYRIKIDLSNPEMELKPGMPADARIQLAGDGA